MAGQRGKDVAQVLQGLASVLSQLAKTEGQANVNQLISFSKHSKGVLESLAYAARAAGSGAVSKAGEMVPGSASYPPKSPFAPVSTLPRLTPQQLMEQQQQQQHHQSHTQPQRQHQNSSQSQHVATIQAGVQPIPTTNGLSTSNSGQRPSSLHSTQGHMHKSETSMQPHLSHQQISASVSQSAPSQQTTQPSITTADSHNKHKQHAANSSSTKSVDTQPLMAEVPILDDPSAETLTPAETSTQDQTTTAQSPRRGRTRAVPSTPLARVLGFGQLAAGLAMGTVAEALRQGVGSKPRQTAADGSSGTAGSTQNSSYAMTDANAERLAEGLCRMRGAALKLGQMLSIQDESLIPPQLSKALERVRAGADWMPPKQLHKQLSSALGSDWRDKLAEFQEEPIAAASIGQVHKATLKGGEQVAMKIQYPGVANSIESDLSNLERLVTITNILPPGLFIEEVVEVAREELKLECNYELEASNQERFRELVQADAELSQHVHVPRVMREFVTQQVLTTEMVQGVAIDRVASMSQETRNHVASLLLRVTMKELFEWRFMQTDPNWGNYMFDPASNVLHLIDFGACRDYDKHFIDSYLELVWSAAQRDTATLERVSKELKFLTGDESPEMLQAHIAAGLVVGEPFMSDEAFDFNGSHLTTRISKHGEAFAKHRLTPPPREAYSLHRKLAGAFLACIKLRAKIKCREILVQTYEDYHAKSVAKSSTDTDAPELRQQRM